MTRHGRVAVGGLVLLAALSLVSGRLGAAASFVLSDTQAQAALRFGAASTATDGFDAEWRVAGADGESVLVLTPFHRLALAARHAAFRNEELRPAEIERLRRDHRDRLVFWVELRGASEDFAHRLAPELGAGGRVIKPAFVQNERTAVRREGGGFLARCLYAFPVAELGPSTQVTLLVRDGDGRQIRAFGVDLARMR